MTSSCSILSLLILTSICLRADLLLIGLILAVVTAVEIDLATRPLIRRTQEVSFVMIVVLYSQVLCFLRQCLLRICLEGVAIINESIIGMNASLNFFYWSLRSRLETCFSLQRSYVIARSPLSTKIRSEKYSDL